MSRKVRNLLLALGGVVVLSGVLVLLLLTNKTVEVNKTYTLFNKDSAAISKVEVTKLDGTYSLVRTSDSWQVNPYPDIAVDKTNITSAISSLSDIEGNTLVDENPADPSIYGLATPAATLVITASDGSTFTCELGSEAPGQYGYYLRVKGQTTVYAVNTTTLTVALQTPYYFLTKEVIPATTSSGATRIELSGQGIDGTIVLKRLETSQTDAAGYDYRFQLLSPYTAVAGTDLDSKYFTNLPGVNATEVFSVNTTDEGLKNMGLLNPAHTVKFTLDGNLYEMHVGNLSNDNYFVRLGDSRTVFLVSSTDLPWIKATLQGVLARTPFAPIINDTASMTVSGGGNSYTFNFTGKVDSDLAIKTGSGSAIDYANFTNFYRFAALTKGDDSAAGKTKGEVLLTLTYKYRDSSKADHVITFYRADGYTAIMSVDGVANFTVGTSYLDKILADAATVSQNKPTSLLW